MKLLSEDFLKKIVLILFLFCQSVFTLPSYQRPTNDVSTESYELTGESKDSEEVTSTSDKMMTIRNEEEENNKKKAVIYLKKYGYINDKIKERSSFYFGFLRAIKKLQKYAGIQVSGKLDVATMKLMNQKRCQLPDLSDSTSFFGKRFNAINSWRRKRLTYNILSYPTKSFYLKNFNKVDNLIETAFNDWSSVANVNFTKSKSRWSNIKVSFLSRNHGDGDGFDGKGHVLAHAFFPQDGRLHFDNDEFWTNGRGTNLRQVATHEIGHILGLGHSKIPNSVMYAYFSYRPNFRLHEDDIKGAVSLYGKSKMPITKSKPFFVGKTTTYRMPKYNWSDWFFYYFNE